MRSYRQLTSEERYALATLRRQGYTMRGIARALGRAPSTISREVRRNRRKDGRYRAFTADQRARARRSRSRRNQRFTADDWALVLTCLEQQWSPEQISGRLSTKGVLRISHESIYRHIWHDKRRGGARYKLLRQAGKKRRKRYGAYDSRGRLAGKRHISERPPAVEDRIEVGHWEIDTVLGPGKPCIVTLVERGTGLVMIGKMRARTVAELNRATLALISDAQLPMHTITADNGTEFHGYKDIEAQTGVRFFFATPHHSWERGSSENANGLIRQYLPKRKSMARLSQDRCDAIAEKLNTRPRKRYGYRSPKEECELRCD
jgi:IS30 family transposase